MGNNFAMVCLQICLLGLLGAQCVNKHQDYDSGLRFWKEALESLEMLSKVRVGVFISHGKMSR